MLRQRLSQASIVMAAVLAIASSAHAGKLLVSEVCYDEVGSTFDGEWFEIYNGSGAAIDLSNYKIGDEETKLGTGATEAMFQFPAGASIAPGEVQVIASYASRFKSLYGFAPNYECGSSVAADAWTDDAAVPNMSIYGAWDPDGAKLNMSNTNDQFLFLDANDNTVDQGSWGASTFFFNPALLDNQASGQSYERIDVSVDTDTAADWMLGSAPLNASWTSKSSPGTLPVPAVYAWTADGDGTWSIDANWHYAKIPNGAGQTVLFGNTITAPHSIVVDTARTAGTLRIDSTLAYTVGGTETLTLDRAVTVGPVKIEVLRGTDHRIDAPLKFAKPGIIEVAADASLTIAGPVDSVAVGLTKAGGGMLTVRGVRASSLTVSGGTVLISGGPTEADNTTKVASLSVDAGARLNLEQHALVVDYATPGESPLLGLTTAIKEGRIGSNLSASDASRRLGLIDNATRSTPLVTFGGIEVDATSVLAIATYGGDADLDIDVDFDDLLSLARAYNTPSGATWSAGDFDYDADVDFDDLLQLARNYNRRATPSDAAVESIGGVSFAADWALAQSLVPEPTSLLASFGVAGAFAPRRRPAPRWSVGSVRTLKKS